MHSLLLLSCLLSVALAAVGYAPAPQVAPAPTSYGNPQPQQVYIPQAQQPLPVFSQQSQQFPQQFPSNNNGNFNSALPQAAQPFNGNGLSSQNNNFQGQGPVSSLTGEDDWDSVITARGVKNVKLARQFRRQ